MINIEQLRAIVHGGPPIAPDGEHPGAVLGAFLAELDGYQKDRGDQPINGVEVVGLLAHVLDLERWRAQMAQFAQLKSMLEEIDRKVIVPGLQAVK